MSNEPQLDGKKLTANCPHCGEKLEIPVDLAQAYRAAVLTVARKIFASLILMAMALLAAYGLLKLAQ